jgi:phosphate starvation-inducible PhoH-like protein
LNQRRYIEAIKNNDIVFGIGPGGTGKTFLAVAMAITCLMEKSVSRIVLTRPAVEAGEKLGFLPGDIEEKINPYLRPLYDALYILLDNEKIQRYMEDGTIEIAPLAFMRGRTLNDAFIILDEAQNTTSEQMKMFLTRIGMRSKAVITGDITQIDLPFGRCSGLVEAHNILSDVAGIAFCIFNENDVVRHHLVRLIIKAYQQHAENGMRSEGSGKNDKR